MAGEDTGGRVLTLYEWRAGFIQEAGAAEDGRVCVWGGRDRGGKRADVSVVRSGAEGSDNNQYDG